MKDIYTNIIRNHLELLKNLKHKNKIQQLSFSSIFKKHVV